jgi:putative transposase
MSNAYQLYNHMAAQRRKFTDQEKLNIIQQVSRQGVTAVLREHSLSYSVFAKWKQKFIGSRDSGSVYSPNRARSELKQLAEENARLKRIIADQALEIELKNEQLKKIGTNYNK